MHSFYVIPLLICWSLVSIGRTNAAYTNATLNMDPKNKTPPPAFNCSDLTGVKYYLDQTKDDLDLPFSGCECDVATTGPNANVLTFRSPKRVLGGRYFCVGAGPAGASTNRTYDIFVPAYVENMGKSKSVMYGDEAKLVCTYWGYPKVKIYWKKEGNDLHFDNLTNLRLESTDEDNKGVSTLKITNVQEGDRAHYACIVENDTPSAANSTVLLRVKDKLAALWPFLGICAEVIILCTIILIYERRRSKHSPEPEESEQSQDLINKDKTAKGDVKKRATKT